MDTHRLTSHRFWIALPVLFCLVLTGCPKDKSNDPPADSDTSDKNRSDLGAGDAASPATKTPAANKAEADAALANLKKYHFADIYLSTNVDAEITESGKKPYTSEIRVDERFGSHGDSDHRTRKNPPFRVTWDGTTFHVKGTHNAANEHFTTVETVDLHGQIDPTPIETQSNPTPTRVLRVEGTLSMKTVQGNLTQKIDIRIKSGPVPFDSYYIDQPKRCNFKWDGSEKKPQTLRYTRVDTMARSEDGKAVTETTTRRFTGDASESGELSVSFYYIPK